MKVFLFYLENELYAYTNDIEFKEKFITQRNMNKLICIKKKLTESQYEKLKDDYYDLEITEFSISDNNQYFNLTLTPQEEYRLMDEVDIIAEEICIIRDTINRLPLLDKHKDNISIIGKDIFQYIPRDDGDETFDKYINLDMLHLFYTLFGDIMK